MSGCQQVPGCGASPETVATIRVGLAPPPVSGGVIGETAAAVGLLGELAGAEPGPVAVGLLVVAGPAGAEPGPAEESGADTAGGSVGCLLSTASGVDSPLGFLLGRPPTALPAAAGRLSLTAAARDSPLGNAGASLLGTASRAAAALEGGRGLSGMRLRDLQMCWKRMRMQFTDTG